MSLVKNEKFTICKLTIPIECRSELTTCWFVAVLYINYYSEVNRTTLGRKHC